MLYFQICLSPRDAETNWQIHLIDEQSVSLLGLHTHREKSRLPEEPKNTLFVLPSLDSNIRVAFDLLPEQFRIPQVIAAEVDDIAVPRLLAR